MSRLNRQVQHLCAFPHPTGPDQILPNKAIKFAPAYGLRRTALSLRENSAAYRWR